MTDRYEYAEGKCYACKEIKQVRWKNLYTIGSEGTDLCIECELKVVNFVRNLARTANKAIIKERKKSLQFKKDLL